MVKVLRNVEGSPHLATQPLTLRTEQGRRIDGFGTMRRRPTAFGAPWAGYVVVLAAHADLEGEQVTVLDGEGFCIGRGVVASRGARTEAVAALRLSGVTVARSGCFLWTLRATPRGPAWGFDHRWVAPVVVKGSRPLRQPSDRRSGSLSQISKPHAAPHTDGSRPPYAERWPGVRGRSIVQATRRRDVPLSLSSLPRRRASNRLDDSILAH